METVYLSLGSNVGDRRENILTALSLLKSSGFVNIMKISSLYETSPVGFRQRYFYNIALKAVTPLSCCGVLSFVKQAEQISGRRPSKRWGPRIIDIDILFYGAKIIQKDGLSVPHKEIENRLFVLMPLNEIAGNYVHPVSNRKINQILQAKKLTLKNQKVKIIKNINNG